jgi:hypothetical protein
MKKSTQLICLICGLNTGLFAQQINSISLGTNLNNASAVLADDSIQFQLFAGMQHAQISNRPKQLGLQVFKYLPSQQISVGLTAEIASFGLAQNTLVHVPVTYHLQVNEDIKVNSYISLGISLNRINTSNIIITDANDPSINGMNNVASKLYYQFGATGFYKTITAGFAYHAKQVNHEKGVLLAQVTYDYTINDLFKINIKTLIASANQTNLLQISPGVSYDDKFCTGLYFDSNVPVGMYFGYAITPDWQLLYQHNRPDIAWLGGQNLISIRYRMN